jgi:hypothetical protein
MRVSAGGRCIKCKSARFVGRGLVVLVQLRVRATVRATHFFDRTTVCVLMPVARTCGTWYRDAAKHLPVIRSRLRGAWCAGTGKLAARQEVEERSGRTT